MDGIFGNMFDFNRDGKVDGFERAMEFMFLEEMLKGDSDGDDNDEFDGDDGY